jgi:hypothetical protein
VGSSYQVTESCETLHAAGHLASGYYIVDGPQDTHYFELVLCNMGLPPGDPMFQRATQLKLPKFPVAFDAVRNESLTFGEVGHVLPYDHLVVNDGDGMTLGGSFVVPMDGVYQFNVETLECVYNNPGGTNFEIRVDGGKAVGDSFVSDASPDNNALSASEAVILRLEEGQNVEVYLTSGAVCGKSSYDTHFTGHLLYPV